MSQAQEPASAWSLVGGTFDDGHAIENAESRALKSREMLEDFCSNALTCSAWPSCSFPAPESARLIDQVLSLPSGNESTWVTIRSC
ncbi:hypothetical protein P4050_16520 [Pseudomonas aeruginosa]|nr:hypothetical protein [Pseudomonas aeruginosa]